MPTKLLCQRHPLLYSLSVWHKRRRRSLAWRRAGQPYCHTLASDLPVRIKSHQSVLIRKLGSSDAQLQLNKVKNLQLAAPKVNGILIRPGETFSFWRLVGQPTERAGYLKGMLLSRGEALAGIGGGLCQLSNLIYWMALHTPLTVTERHHHGFDPFPDDGRVLPFGSGATVFYNYIDLQFRNDTPDTWQVKVWVGDHHLLGEIRCSREQAYSYHVLEREHAFVQQDDRWFRRNQIWRQVIDRETGNTIREELITSNFAEARYTPEAVAVAPTSPI